MVTGAASGIGLATAQLLAAQGAAKLILVDRNAEALDGIASRWKRSAMPATSRIPPSGPRSTWVQWTT